MKLRGTTSNSSYYVGKFQSVGNISPILHYSSGRLPSSLFACIYPAYPVIVQYFLLLLCMGP